MARVAPRVYVDAADIAQLEAIAVQLPQDERVQVSMEDGRQIAGMVSATPTVQAFFDPRGREGMNALLRLDACFDDARFEEGSFEEASVEGVRREEARAHPDGIHDLWLDEISAVARLPNPSPPETSTRLHPPDPNAPAPALNDRQA
jgi:hypothetical protein